MNKCYEHHCWVKPRGRPRKHYSRTNIKKGYDKTHWGKFNKIIDELKKERVLYLFPHGDELHCCAILDNAAIIRGIEIANKFRVSEGLPEFPAALKELLEML